MIDDDGIIADESVENFIRAYVERFYSFIVALNGNTKTLPD